MRSKLLLIGACICCCWSAAAVLIAETQQAPAKPTSSVDRTAQFLEGLRDGKIDVSGEIQQLARKAAASNHSWREFTDVLRKVAPQLDRTDWTTVGDGKLTVERVAQDGTYSRLAAAGTSLPADGLLLAQYAAAKEPIVHQELTGLQELDFRLMSRAYGSSCHVPVTIAGRRGILSFWSTDIKAFPPELTTYLGQVAQEIEKGNRGGAGM